MAGSTIKLGVDVTEFKRGMTEAQSSVKTLDAAIKTNEKSMQLYGKSESYVSTQAGLLNQKLEEQKKIIQNGEKALKTMEENGVSKTSKAYQDLYRKLIEARGAMIDTTVELNQLTTGEAEAAKGADELANSVSGISRKMSLDQIISGIDSVTNALGNAAKNAIDLGEKLFNVILESAAQADDIATMAERLGLTEEQVQQINFNAARFEVTAEQLGKTWKKVKNNMASDSDEITQAFEELGIQTHEIFAGKYGEVVGPARDYKDVFWEVGDALYHMTDAAKQEQLAQKLLGRSWDELRPLFKAGREEYEAALAAAPTASEEAVDNMASLNDRMKELEASWETLKLEALGAIAPALEKGADALATLIDKITAYLQTDAGQELLTKLGNAVSDLFDDLTKIDPEKTVQAFVDVFTKVTDGIQWLVDNKEAAKGILGAIVAGWGTLTLTGDVLKIIKLVDGIKGFFGAEKAAEAAGKAVGSSWASGFARGLIAVAPWLAEILGVSGIALTPAYFAQKFNEEQWKNDQQRREEAAALGGEYSEVIAQGAAAIGPKKNADGSYKTDWTGLFLNMNPTDAAYDVLMGLSAYQNQQRAELFNIIRKYSPFTVTQNGAGYTIDELLKFWGGEEFDYASVDALLTSITDALAQHAENAVQVPAEIDIPDDTAQKLSQEIGMVRIQGEVIPGESVDGEQANGIWSVPFDGYLARLHKNERVVPAREVASRSYSSNLYVEHMIMNNGTDAEGLAAAMAAKQRQTMTGFGS